MRKRGRERGRGWLYLPVYLGSAGSSLGGNGFIWVNEFKGILERFSGYVLRGLSVNGCIVSASSALSGRFRCFLGLKVSDKEKCSYLWHDFIYYVYKKKSLKNFLVECL